METTMDPVGISQETAGEVKAKTIYLAIKVGSFGNAKQADLLGVVFNPDEPDQEPDKALLRLSKKLIDSPELEAIRKHDRAWQAKVRSLAFSAMFKGGVHLLPLTMVTTASEIIEEAIVRRRQLVDIACGMYQTRVDETVARLGSAARATDYPSVERFRASFYVEYQYFTFDTPTRLKAISAAVFMNETNKARKQLETVAESCRQAMRAGLMQLMSHLSERITPTEDGKSKRLAVTTIDNLNAFLSVFELKNVTDDAQLGDIVNQCRAVMTGVDHKLLKSDELARQKVLDEITALQTSLEPLIIDRTRTIELE